MPNHSADNNSFEINNTLREYFLHSVLNFLIPADPSKKLPSGSEAFNQKSFLQAKNSWFDEGLTKISTECQNLYNTTFMALSESEQANLFLSLQRKNATFFTTMMRLLVEQYYQNGKTLQGIGYGNRAPFPDGHHVIEGDLTLLEDVFCRDKQVYKNV